MHRTKKSRFDARVKCTVNDLIDALSQVNASCSLYYRRPYESCIKMLDNAGIGGTDEYTHRWYVYQMKAGPNDQELTNKIRETCLRWPNTVFARAFADAIQHVHKDFKKQTCRQ